jgi:hypothetical protein
MTAPDDPAALEAITALEASWLGRVATTARDRYFDWQPAAPALFTRLLAACLPHVPPGNRTFIDAGCGIGTKCLLAGRYGLAAHGIDRVPEYVAEAARLGVSAELALIEDYTGFARYGLVYVDHPAVGGGDEARLEAGIHAQMAPRSVLMAMSYDLAPGCPAHPPGRPCDDACPTDAHDGWTEVARLGAWIAGWVKRLWPTPWSARTR